MTSDREDASRQLRITALDGTEMVIDAELQSLVSDVKASLASQCGIPPEEQGLACNGIVFSDNLQIRFLCVEGGAVSELPSEQIPALTLVRVQPTALLCGKALQNFVVENLTTGIVNITLTSDRMKPFSTSLTAEQKWTYAEPEWQRNHNAWGPEYLPIVNLHRCTAAGNKTSKVIASGEPSEQFKIEAIDEFGYVEEWEMKFARRDGICGVAITGGPDGSTVSEEPARWHRPLHAVAPSRPQPAGTTRRHRTFHEIALFGDR